MKKTINECFFQIKNGANIKQGLKNGGYPITRIETISNDKFNRDKMGYAGITDSSQYENYILEDNDLLMSHINSPQYLGRTVLYKKVDDETIIHGMNLLRLKAIKEVNPGYARYYFYGRNFRQQIAKITKKSVNQASFAVNDLKRIKIHLPDMEQQNNIVHKLDTVNQLIDFYKQFLTNYDLLIKARFVEMFGDPATPGVKFKTCKLGKVADVKSGHRVFTTEFVDEGVPFYRGTEIGVLASGQQPEDPYRISMEHYLKIASDDSKPLRGDLLLPSICNKGQVWMVNTDEPFYYKDGRVLCISPDRSVFDSRYLQFYMKMRTEAEYPKLGSGSTFAEFKIFQLKELEVDIPPMNAQKSFDLFVDQVDKSKFGD